MVELRRVYDNLSKYVEIAYTGDEELLNKYHVGKYTLEEAVDVTMKMISITSHEASMKFCEVLHNKEEIGYVCYFSNNLYSFGININKRNKEILSELWVRIKERLGNSFITILYPNNTRAIQFLQKCGMVIVPDIEENCVTLLNIN